MSLHRSGKERACPKETLESRRTLAKSDLHGEDTPRPFDGCGAKRRTGQTQIIERGG